MSSKTKSKSLKWLSGIFCLLLCTQVSFAQNMIKVNGKITDSKDNTALPRATVLRVGGKESVVANDQGQFEITVPAGSNLRIMMSGYDPVTVKAAANMLVSMNSQLKKLDEVVVIGYGTQKRELLTGSVGVVKMDEAKRLTPTTAVGNLLTGQVAGVNVSNPAGSPGTQPKISIRVGTSFAYNKDDNADRYTPQGALYVIDGKVSGAGDFNNLSPNDIDNITILKDAASTAVYGSRATGGVIVVTTRTGSKNTRPQINYSYSTGIDKRAKGARLTNAIESGKIYNRINPGSPGAYTDEEFEYFKTINNGWGYDQLGAVWQDPSVSTHNLGVSGGGEKISYYVGGSYTRQEAAVKNLTYNKYNVRANLTADITKRLQLFAGLTVNNNQRYSPPTADDFNDWYGKLNIWQPYLPIFTPSGKPISHGWIMSMGGQVRGDGGYYKTDDIKPIVNLKMTYKVPGIEGLSAAAQFNKSYTNKREKKFEKQYDMMVMKSNGRNIIYTSDDSIAGIQKSSQISKNYIQEKYGWSNDYQLNLFLNYDRTFGQVHHVKGWLVYERSEAQGGGITGGREGFPVYLTDQWWAASDARLDDWASGDTEYKEGRKSYIGQFFYDYDSKYLASFSYRYDGSMRFPADKRWGFFPSGSLGWVVSKENFFDHVKGIDMLKLRASLGTTSADNIDGWQWQQTYQGGNSIFLGSTPVNNVGLTYGQIINPDLTWEKTSNYNVGVDINFLHKFSGSAEYYFIKTWDILGRRLASVPPTFSRTLPSSNYGQINARGVEVSLGYRDRKGKLSYYANVNASYGGAKYVIQDQNITYPWQKNAGNSVSRIATYVVNGMIRTPAELEAFKTANPNYKFNGIAPEVGQLTYQDMSGKDGKPDGIIDQWDIQTVARNNDPVVLGLNLGAEWKGISLDATFSGNFHQKRYVNNLVDGNVEWNRMWYNWYSDAWTPETPDATLPRRYSANDGSKSVTNTQSTFWLKNANFLRLRFLNIGYTIPARFTDKAGIQGIKVFFSGSNLFVISKFNKEYYDPENAGPFAYPLMKTFNFGVNVSL